MGKARELVITNGKAVFYACMWDDLKNAALDCGWALGLHGSLNSDMDIMAMPWIQDCKHIGDMLDALEACFVSMDEGHKPLKRVMTKNKPNNRVVYTLHIWADFYLDINVIESPTPSTGDKETEK